MRASLGEKTQLIETMREQVRVAVVTIRGDMVGTLGRGGEESSSLCIQ